MSIIFRTFIKLLIALSTGSDLTRIIIYILGRGRQLAARISRRDKRKFILIIFRSETQECTHQLFVFVTPQIRNIRTIPRMFNEFLWYEHSWSPIRSILLQKSNTTDIVWKFVRSENIFQESLLRDMSYLIQWLLWKIRAISTLQRNHILNGIWY